MEYINPIEVGVIVLLLSTGAAIGRIWATARAAHDRLDKLELIIEKGLEGLRSDLREAIREGWRHCPRVGPPGGNP